MKLIKITFSEVRIKENFRRADGINGASFDKTSHTKARLCCEANNIKPIFFEPDTKVFVIR